MSHLESYAAEQQRDLHLGRRLVAGIRHRLSEHSPEERRILFGSFGLSLISLPVLLVAGYPEVNVTIPPSYAVAQAEEPEPAEPLRPPPEPIDYSKPVRPIPARFPLHTRMPGPREINHSTPISAVDFDPERDLVVIEDDRVWWESDNDDHTGDTENDHVMHRAMEVPFRRLVELAVAEGITLKVQDTYRAEGVHHASSLHKHGRAIDLTAFDTPLSRVGALTWAAGFDWVYYEKKGGYHIHASVKAD